jgi:hypothetical protein
MMDIQGHQDGTRQGLVCHQDRNYPPAGRGFYAVEIPIVFAKVGGMGPGV